MCMLVVQRYGCNKNAQDGTRETERSKSGEVRLGELLVI
jgi:hypothetical protein